MAPRVGFALALRRRSDQLQPASHSFPGLQCRTSPARHCNDFGHATRSLPAAGSPARATPWCSCCTTERIEVQDLINPNAQDVHFGTFRYSSLGLGPPPPDTHHGSLLGATGQGAQRRARISGTPRGGTRRRSSGEAVGPRAGAHKLRLLSTGRVRARPILVLPGSTAAACSGSVGGLADLTLAPLCDCSILRAVGATPVLDLTLPSLCGDPAISAPP